MHKRVIAIGLIAVIAIGALAAWLILRGLRAETTIVTDDFEQNFGEWKTDSAVPEDPNNPGETVAWKIERRTSNDSYDGVFSVLLQIDGRQDDGTIWIERKFELQPSSLKSVNLSFQLWSDSESFNTLAEVVGYIGCEDPEIEGDFQVIGPANQVSGWKEYGLSTELNTGSTGEVFVALGISVRWESKMSYMVDRARVVIS